MLQRYQDWNLRKKQRSLESWTLERAKGKRRYVLHQAFTFAVIMTAARDVFNHLDGHGEELWSLWIYLVLYAIGGLFVGSLAWGSREGQYKEALRKGHLQKPVDDRLMPH